MISSRRLISCLSVGLMLLNSWCSAIAATSMAMPIPAPPKLQSKSYIIVDAYSNKILAAAEANRKVEPASLTKLMTAYLTSKALHAGTVTPDQLIPVSKKAWQMQGSRMFIEVGKKVPVAELLNGVIIQSGNDASVALAEAIAGSEESFVDLMNAQAQQLGMKDTHFMNATGLPSPEHYSTAHDIAILSKAVINDFPEHYDIYSHKWFNYNNIKQSNRNRLLWSDPSVDGLKTGHTNSAGYCLASSAKRGDMRLISVLIGADSEEARARESRQLLAYGFQYFETHKLYDHSEPLTSKRVWMGATAELPLGLAKDLVLTVPKGSYQELTAELLVNTDLKAPIKHGDVLGKVVVKLHGEPITERPLLALADIAEGSLWIKFKDSIKMKINQWVSGSEPVTAKGTA